MRSLLRAFLILIIPAMLIGLSPVHPAPADAEVVIIVNKTNTVTDITPDYVRKLLLCDINYWPNRRRVAVLMLPSGDPGRNAVLRSFYKMNDSEFTKYFMQASFTGRVQMIPHEVSSTEDMKKQIAENPGAIGFLKRADLDGSVRVIFVIP